MSKLKKGKDSGALRIGAVAYDPKVVTIWEDFKAYLSRHGVETDYILYSNYESQVDALLSGAIEVAWNSPLAWVRSHLETHGRCRALAMRDTDRDLTTLVVVRKNSGIAALGDLKRKTVAVGASDSPQATLIPLEMLAEAGVMPEKDCRVLYHNLMVGKHGDHLGGERDAARALASGQADAACVLDGNLRVFFNEGTLDPDTTTVLAKTPPFDHCNFTALAELADAKSKSFLEALLEMSPDDPTVCAAMQMEGLKRWLPGRTSGYGQLENAVRRFHFYA